MEPRPAAALAALVGAKLCFPGPEDAAEPCWRDSAGARLVGPDVVIDSREATPGSLFVALPGERADGHDFIAAAARSGAAAALVRRPVAGAGLVQLVVSDPLAALAALARGLVAEARGHLLVIGLTGSSGKTTTKDILSQVLAQAAPTVAPAGSFNNEIGVPLTAARIGRSTRYLVSELGARGPGHITALCGIVNPEIGLVLNVGAAHAGEFGSPAATAAAKGELVDCLPADGWAVLNADDPLVAALASRHLGPTAWFSHDRPASLRGQRAVWASAVEADAGQRHAFRLHDSACPGGSWPVRLRFPGPHQVANALAAAAAALAAGLAPEAVAVGLSAAEPLSRWRLEIRRRNDGLTVINDAYNANPDSMRVALATAAGLWRARRREQPKARLVAVLGDMLELGPEAEAQHGEVGRLAAASGVSRLVAVGAWAPVLAAAAAAAGAEARPVGNRDAAVSQLDDLGPADIVLVKASRGVGLEAVACALLAEKDGPC
ncbi:MAG: UDP-N-acetylmuramoyl-tripeptide--D-alanyl-D-alanine ligase [Propionibacteriaceae bacterium]|jgi:UDP-N-acetylmuramoyl-tripeptide--D-alanyl-D-alanine ligase|nr:UDP-N-acetylmuramoyl-tripeptide--D-alanyl-D-alanine ligase [Propionibacteriaceae bacterium]